MSRLWALIGWLLLPVLLLMGVNEAHGGQKYYSSEASHQASRWYLIDEACRDKLALNYVPPELLSRAKHGNVIVPGWGRTYSFCWMVTKKDELLRFWPNGRIDLDSIYHYQDDKGI